MLRHTVLTTAILAAVALAGSRASAQFSFNPYPDARSGPQGDSDGRAFDHRIPFGKQIVTVELRVGASIDNIRLGYQNRDRTGPVQWTPWCGRGTGGSLRRFQVPPGDVLSSIQVGVYTTGLLFRADWVKQLTLRTFGGRVAVYGHEPDRVEPQMSSQGEIVGLHGTALGYIESLGIVSRHPFTDASTEVPAQPALPLRPFGRIPFVADSQYGGHDFIWRISVNYRDVGHRVITGIRVFWRRSIDRETASYETPWIGENGDDPSTGSLDQFIVPPDDYLTDVRVSYATQPSGVREITGIYLETKGLAIRTLGRLTGSWVYTATPEAGEVFALWGGLNPTGDRLLELGVNHRSFAGLVHRVDSGCAGAPSLVPLTSPAIRPDANREWSVGIQSSDPSALRVLLFGFYHDFHFGGCELLVSLLDSVQIPVSGTQGRVPMPAVPSLLGLKFTAQVVESLRDGPILGVATASNALSLRVGMWRVGLR